MTCQAYHLFAVSIFVLMLRKFHYDTHERYTLRQILSFDGPSGIISMLFRDGTIYVGCVLGASRLFNCPLIYSVAHRAPHAAVEILLGLMLVCTGERAIGLIAFP